MKKIAILIDLELSKKSGGHVKFWERICESLKEEILEIKMELFFLGKKSDTKKINKFISFNKLKPLLSTRNLRFIGIDADYTDIFPFNFGLFLKLRKFDLIHTTDQLFAMSRTARLASFFWKIPLTTSFHTDTPSYSKYYLLKILNSFPNILKNLLIEKIKLHEKVSVKQKSKILDYFNQCKKIMICKSNLKTELKTFKNKEKLINLERGINKSIFIKKKINKKSVLSKFDINKKNKIILFCGRIHELKGAIFLSEVHKKLKEKGVGVTTILIGENIHGKVCKKIGGTGLLVLDYLNQDEISVLMNICDLFVFPSLYETGLQVVLEAKSCEAVCVVSPNGGGKRIKNNIDGIIVKKYKVCDWTKVIYDLFAEREKIKKIKNYLNKNDTQPSWKDVFFNNFYNNWKKILNVS